MKLLDKFKNAWNAFSQEDKVNWHVHDIGPAQGYRPDQNRMTRGNERTFITSVINRIALDVADVDIMHVRLDDQGRFLEQMESDLNDRFLLEANIDQSSKAFMEDAVIAMLDKGHVALVPVYTTDNPYESDSYGILSMRTGEVVSWYPKHVRINVYDENTQQRKEVTMPKSDVCIIQNPFYAVMNEPNSTLHRLVRKLTILDVVDEKNADPKLNMIIQLPYIIKTEARKQQAEQRRKEIEEQLNSSKYGIAYTDGTEHITQLNRPLETNLMSQIEYLINLLFSQLGMTQEILNGTADESTMLNYRNRIVKVIVEAFASEIKRKWLTAQARARKQSIMYFIDPFELVPVSNIAEIADKFTRNEIMTSNEIRQVIGMKPSDNPDADELRNKNLNKQGGELPADSGGADVMSIVNEMLDGLMSDIDGILGGEEVEEDE